MAVSFIRTIILYILIIFALRAMGKRQVGELSPSEFVITLLVSELATIPMQNTDTPLFFGIVPVLTLFSLEILLSSVFLKSRFIRKIIAGKTNILISNGKINQAEMKKLRLTLDELLEEIRLKGFIDISEIKYAILEANGELSVFPFSKNDSLTREDMNITSDTTFLPHTIISDGALIKSELLALNKTERWVYKQISKEGLCDFSEVFLMQVSENGKSVIIPKVKNK